MLLSDSILDFYFSLPKESAPPNGVEIIFPYDQPETRRVMEIFFRKYYADLEPRTLLFGINPGRYGAGITGIGFTDPILLEQRCGIENHFEKRGELSAKFIYDVIEAYGGVERFYKDFLFTTVLPFGLLKNGKNYNYYDDTETLHYFKPLILESIQKQRAFPHINQHKIAVIGQGKNLHFMKSLNEEERLFDTIEVLPHPRWVMQYRRRQKDKYIQYYLKILREIRPKID